MSAPARCVFPPCPAFGAGVGGDRLCSACGRPLGGPAFGPGGGYRVEALLGSGYVADVFRVLDLGSGGTWAAKLYADEPDRRRAFAAEVEALTRLTHPRLPRLVGAFRDAGWSFVVMELVEGASLRARVEAGGPLPVERVLAIGREVGEALARIAARGWTYRDLHPRNVHPETPRGAMLVDLDGARPPGAPARPAGRIGYRAPELDRAGLVTSACDVYSLAGCLAFALSGDDPPPEPGRLPGIADPLRGSPALLGLLESCRRADPAGRPTFEALLSGLACADRPG